MNSNLDGCFLLFFTFVETNPIRLFSSHGCMWLHCSPDVGIRTWDLEKVGLLPRVVPVVHLDTVLTTVVVQLHYDSCCVGGHQVVVDIHGAQEWRHCVVMLKSTNHDMTQHAVMLKPTMT